MAKKVLVDKKWYDNALAVVTGHEDKLKAQTVFIETFQVFIFTVLTSEQQKNYRKEWIIG